MGYKRGDRVSVVGPDMADDLFPYVHGRVVYVDSDGCGVLFDEETAVIGRVNRWSSSKFPETSLTPEITSTDILKSLKKSYGYETI